MKIFITGGSGFLGINLARYLLDRGHDVGSIDLLPFDYPDCSSRVRSVVGDIRDVPALEAAMRGYELVVHAAAALPLYSPEDIFSTDVQGTRNVLETASRLGIPRVVHISTTAVYGIPDHHPLLETDKLDGVGPYGAAKIQAEEVCLEYRGKGMCVPIIRPKSFIGPERLGVFALFYDWAQEGRGFPMIGNGKNRYQFLDVEDLCDAIYALSFAEPAVANDTYNIGAKEFSTMGEDYQAVLDRAGYGKKIVCFPSGPVILALRVLDALRLSPLYKWVYETASKDSFVSIDKAAAAFGYSPKFSNKDALLRNYEWYMAHKDEFANATGISHRVPWKQGLLGLAKAFF